MNHNIKVSNIKKLFVSWIVLMVCFFILICTLAQMGVKNGIPVDVYINASSKYARCHTDYLPGGSYFTSGTDGKLLLKPVSFTTALVLDTLSGSGIDIFHLALLCLYIGSFYFMMSRSNEVAFFTKKTIYGAYAIAFLITTTGMLEFLKFIFVSSYFENLTKGQFLLPLPAIPYMYFCTLGGFFGVMTNFIQKAFQLQQVAELTI